MGGHNWSLELSGADLHAAFDEAAAQDRAEYGANGHSGEIGQAAGVAHATNQVCHPLEAAYLAHELANYHEDANDDSVEGSVGQGRADRLLARLGLDAWPRPGRFSLWNRDYRSSDSLPVALKWDSAFAIPLADPSAFTLTERAVPLDVTSLGQQSAYPNERVLALLETTLTGQLGATPRIAKVEVLDDTPKYRTTVKATDGAVVTRYKVYRRSPHHGGQLVLVSGTPHRSVAAARAEITDLLSKPDGNALYSYASGEVEYVALGEKVREDGSPLVVGRRELVSRYVVYTVTVVRPAKTTPPVTGWLVYGLAGD